MAWSKVNRRGVVELPGEYYFETGDDMVTTDIVNFSKATNVDTGQEYVFYNGAWNARNPLFAIAPDGNTFKIDSENNVVQLDDNTVKIDSEDNVIQLNDNTVQIDALTAALEELTNGLKFINTDHALIHDGYGMCMHLFVAEIAAEGKQIYRFNGPDTLFAHIKGIVGSGAGADCAVRLIRGTVASPLVITNAGTEVSDAIQNLNDNSSEVAQSSVYASGVTYTGGTAWCQKVVHGDTSGTGNKTAFASASFSQNENQEYVTKDGNTDYILEIEVLDDTDSAVNINIDMFFYEESQGLATPPS